ncbi:cholesterol 24-hydroxylase-like [Dendronephthya gigantea]|uniref:cholesterol 24-hydroxylase-like n=1 Tax=Dendronephthya gigantea TaxID=151771 RepID=UPI001069E270|nr:cholesterol 24-hydroxylase-like [Dendronephthya gigantea]
MAVSVLSLLSYIFAAILVGCLGFVLFYVAYLYYVHKINDHLPGPPRSSFIFGHLPDIQRYQTTTGRTLDEFLLKIRLEYGPIFVLHFLHLPIVFLADATYLRHVFITNYKSLHKSPFFYDKIGFVYGERGLGYGLVTNTNEESWRKHRQIMNPAFHRKCLKEFISNFNDVSDMFMIRMDSVVDGGQPTSMVQEFGKVTLEAISQVSFNINTHAIEDPNSPFPAAVRDYMIGVQDNFDNPLSPTLLGIFQFKLFQNATKRKQIAAARFLRMFASDCIKTRMKDISDGKAVPNDLLSILIKNGSLSMDDMIDEFVTIFLAGQETTANSLSFALYEIISNPHVEEKLLNELDTVLAGRDYVEFDDLAKMTYLGQVLEENLRKHPIASEIPAMVSTKDITIGDCIIPKGDSIHSTPLIFGMNPEIWKDPEIFEPERFSNTENIPNFSMTHFPFSIGPHNCIGQMFAKFESKVILAKLLRKFQFKLLPGQTDRKLERLTITPRDGVMCEVSRRE